MGWEGVRGVTGTTMAAMAASKARSSTPPPAWLVEGRDVPPWIQPARLVQAKAGVKISALARALLASAPPAINTLPLGSNVSV